jgi:hypothetical protein
MSRRVAADGKTWDVIFPGFRSELEAEVFETRLVDLLQVLREAKDTALSEDLLVIQRHPDAAGALADLLRIGARRQVKGQLEVAIAPGHPDRVRLLTEQERRAPPPPPSGRRGERRGTPA